MTEPTSTFRRTKPKVVRTNKTKGTQKNRQSFSNVKFREPQSQASRKSSQNEDQLVELIRKNQSRERALEEAQLGGELSLGRAKDVVAESDTTTTSSGKPRHQREPNRAGLALSSRSGSSGGGRGKREDESKEEDDILVAHYPTQQHVPAAFFSSSTTSNNDISILGHHHHHGYMEGDSSVVDDDHTGAADHDLQLAIAMSLRHQQHQDDETRQPDTLPTTAPQQQVQGFFASLGGATNTSSSNGNNTNTGTTTTTMTTGGPLPLRARYRSSPLNSNNNSTTSPADNTPTTTTTIHRQRFRHHPHSPSSDGSSDGPLSSPERGLSRASSTSSLPPVSARRSAALVTTNTLNDHHDNPQQQGTTRVTWTATRAQHHAPSAEGTSTSRPDNNNRQPSSALHRELVMQAQRDALNERNRLLGILTGRNQDAELQQAMALERAYFGGGGEEGSGDGSVDTETLRAIQEATEGTFGLPDHRNHHHDLNGSLDSSSSGDDDDPFAHPRTGAGVGGFSRAETIQGILRAALPPELLAYQQLYNDGSGTGGGGELQRLSQLLGGGVGLGVIGSAGGDDDMSYEQLVQLEDVKVGLPIHILNTIPLWNFKKSDSTAQSDALGEGRSCPVCLEEFEDGEEVNTLFCTHIFHTTCVTEWLQDHKTCPVCKLDMVELHDNITKDNFN